MKKFTIAPLLAALAAAASMGANAQIPAPPDGQILSSAYTGKVYSPYADRDFPSTMDAGVFDAMYDDLDEEMIERSIAEINEAIRRTPAKKG